MFEIPFSRKGDIHRAHTLLRGLIGPDADPQEIFYFVHPGPPRAKARPRVTKSGFSFTPKETRDAQRNLEQSYRRAITTTLDGNIAVACVFFRQNMQRIDSDNMMKLALDAGTKALTWYDDCQVTAQGCIVELDKELPRTLVAICEIESTMDRRGSVAYDCPRCGERFVVQYRGTKTARTNRRKYCGKCTQKKADANCAACGNQFARKASGQRYCSRQCSGGHRQRRPQTEAAQRQRLETAPNL